MEHCGLGYVMYIGTVVPRYRESIFASKCLILSDTCSVELFRGNHIRNFGPKVLVTQTARGTCHILSFVGLMFYPGLVSSTYTYMSV